MGGDLNVGSDLRIMNVSGEWEKIHRILSQSDEDTVRINFGEVNAADGAGMQMFLYVCQIAEDSQGKVLVTGRSERLSQLASLLNLNEYIDEVVQ